MNYTSQNNKTPAIAATAFLAISFLIFAAFSISAVSMDKKLFQICALLSFLAAIYTVSRYLTFFYTYTASDFEFVVEQKYGNSSKTVCRLYYTELIRIIPWKDAKEDIKKKVRRNYHTSLFFNKTYCLFYETAEENGVILLECNQKFAHYLDQYINSENMPNLR